MLSVFDLAVRGATDFFDGVEGWLDPEVQQPTATPIEWEPIGQVIAVIMAKLGEIKLKQIQQLNTADSSLLIRKHKEALNLMMRAFRLDNYGLTWVQFFKGAGLGGLAVWLLMRWGWTRFLEGEYLQNINSF